MKYLVFLALCVLILVGTWLFLGRAADFPQASEAPASVSTNAPSVARLKLPTDTGNHRALLASAQQLKNSAVYDAKDCARLLQYLVTTLTKDEWCDISTLVFSGWQNIILRKEGRELLAPFQDAFYNRILRESGPEVLDSLFTEVAKDSKDKASVTLLVDRLLQESLITTPFETSRQASVICSFMRRSDFWIAQACLSKVQWTAGQSELNSSALPVITCVDICERAERGNYEIAPVIQSWFAAHVVPPTSDSLVPQVIRSSLESIIFRVVTPGGVRAGFPACTTLLDDSVGIPHAEEFWGRMLELLSQQKNESFENCMETTVPFLSAFAAKFKDAKFESQYWVDFSSDIPQDRGAPSRRIACLLHALEAAPDGEARVDLANKLSVEYKGISDFTSARQILEETAGKVSGAAAKEALAAALRSLKRGEDSEDVRRREEEQRVDRGRAKERLSFMKDQLARARKENKPPEDIRSLEGVVRNLEQHVGE